MLIKAYLIYWQGICKMKKIRGKRILLIAYRLAKNIKQEYMAQKLGISKDTYQDIESGKTKNLEDTRKKKISDILDIPIENIDSDNLELSVHAHSGDHTYSATNLYNDNETINLLKGEIQFLKDELNFLKREIMEKNELIKQILSR